MMILWRRECHQRTTGRGSTRVCAGQSCDPRLPASTRGQLCGCVPLNVAESDRRDPYGVVTTPGVRSLKYTPVIGVSVMPTV
jgi:hypothetical protein